MLLPYTALLLVSVTLAALTGPLIRAAAPTSSAPDEVMLPSTVTLELARVRVPVPMVMLPVMLLPELKVAV